MNIQYLNVILLVLIFLINHKKNLQIKLLHLLIGTLIICFLFILIFKEFNVRYIFMSIGIYCALDLIYYLWNQLRKASNDA